ncbi:MAG: hypothetical protein GXO07_04830 [Crenarchaeota archaeon]|nr:hypothetical protein [Thermoproteota archaeon]
MECVIKARIVKKYGDLFLVENELGGLALIPAKELCSVMAKLGICIDEVKC